MMITLVLESKQFSKIKTVLRQELMNLQKGKHSFLIDQCFSQVSSTSGYPNFIEDCGEFYSFGHFTLHAGCGILVSRKI